LSGGAHGRQTKRWKQKAALQRRLDRHSYDRLIILSDGVFAIAITLAAFEIKAPDTWLRLR